MWAERRRWPGRRHGGLTKKARGSGDLAEEARGDDQAGEARSGGRPGEARGCSDLAVEARGGGRAGEAHGCSDLAVEARGSGRAGEAWLAGCFAGESCGGSDRDENERMSKTTLSGWVRCVGPAGTRIVLRSRTMGYTDPPGDC